PPTPSRAAPSPPKAVGTCEAAGICSNPVARPVTPHVIMVWVSGLYELAGQSIISNGVTTYWVVSYGVYAHPILNGFPSGAVAVANGVPSELTASVVVHGMPFLPIGLNNTFCVAGTGCVGQELTSWEVSTGTLVSFQGSSGLPVIRSMTQVIPTLFTNATAGRTTFLPPTVKVPSNMTPLFGRSESHRSWWTCWK